MLSEIENGNSIKKREINFFYKTFNTAILFVYLIYMLLNSVCIDALLCDSFYHENDICIDEEHLLSNIK